MSQFSCLTSLKSLFSPVTTDFRLFDCSTLNWSKNTRTPALHSVQMKVSELHSSVEWRLGTLAVMEAAGSENLPISNGSITIDRNGVVAVVSGDGRTGSDDSYWGCGSITPGGDGVVVVVSGDGHDGGDDSCRV